MLDHVYFFVYSVALIGLATALLVNNNIIFKRFNLLLFAITTMSIVFGLLAFYTLWQFDKLIRFKGISQEENAKLMAKVIAKNFGAEPARLNSTLKYYREANIWKMGKRVIVMLDGDDVLINIATFNFRNIRSPLHGLFDRIKINSIKKDFQNLNENNAA
jgi:hypothetical protein